jgi:hypothetical protein
MTPVGFCVHINTALHVITLQLTLWFFNYIFNYLLKLIFYSLYNNFGIKILTPYSHNFNFYSGVVEKKTLIILIYRYNVSSDVKGEISFL